MKSYSKGFYDLEPALEQNSGLCRNTGYFPLQEQFSGIHPHSVKTLDILPAVFSVR